MKTGWAYFLGGPFDLTKRPKPTLPDDKYIRIAMALPLEINQSEDPDELARPVPIMSVTYRLTSKIPQADGDIAWIYIAMPQR